MGEASRRIMTELNREYLENLATLLEGDGNGVLGEPLTLHRRGHWFKSSIAHHYLQKLAELSQLLYSEHALKYSIRPY